MHRRGNKKEAKDRPGIYMHPSSFDSVFFFGLGVRRTGFWTLGIHSRSPGPRYMDASRTAFRHDERMTEEQPGYKSCKRLATELQREFGSVIEIDEFDVDCDAFGWRLSSQPRLVFSLSNEGSALPEDRLTFKSQSLMTLSKMEKFFLDQSHLIFQSTKFVRLSSVFIEVSTMPNNVI